MSYDFKEQMADSAAENKAEMEATNKDHQKKSNPILNSAGVEPAKRKELRKKNPENTALFDQTYQQMDDKAMRDKFHSEDINVLTAMAIATKKTAEEHNINADNLDQLDATLLDNSNFNAHYAKAIQDINDEVVSPAYATDFYTDKGLEKIDKARTSNTLTKQLKTTGKNNLIEKVVGCENKKCQLDTFKIFEVKKETGIASWLSGEGKLSPSKRAGDKVNAILDKIFLEDEQDKPTGNTLLVDLINGSHPSDEFHLVAGNLTHFQRYIDVSVEGECGHGLGPTCPTINITSNKSKYVEGLSDKKPYFHKDAEALNGFNIAPQSAIDSSEKTTFSQALSLLKMDLTDQTQTYNFFLESCSDSGASLYRDFIPAITIHQPIIVKATMSFGWDCKKRNLSASLALVARVDKDTYQCKLLTEDISGGYEELIGKSYIAKAIEFSGNVYGKLTTLSQTDELADEADPEAELDEANNAEQADGATTNNKNEFDFLPPAINISYLMKRVDQPALNYSETSFVHSVFISGSPLVKFEKTISLKPIIWRKSADYVARGALAAATSGLSEVAVLALKQTDITENVTDSLTNNYYLFKSHIVKACKESALFKGLTSKTLEAGPDGSSDNNNDDDEVTIEDCNQVAEDKSASTFACNLKISAAIETDDPSAGFVFTKRAGGSFYDFDLDSSTSTMYAGLNLQVDTKLSSDMQVLKWMGLGNKTVDVKEAGIKGSAKSADKTGESRCGFTFRFLTKARQQTEKDNKAKALVDKITQYDQDIIDAPLGLCYQVFFSGLSIYIEAFVNFTKSKTAGDKKTELSTDEQAPQSVPSGRQREEEDDEEENFSLVADKQKTLINLRILPARESKYYAVKSILNFGGADNLATE